jgi:hypothetical protein
VCEKHYRTSSGLALAKVQATEGRTPSQGRNEIERMYKMNSLNQRQLQLHVPVVGWLLIVGHAIFVLVGVFVFVLLSGIGVATGEREAMTILTTVGTAVGLLLVVLGIPGLVAGAGLLARKSWARILAIVVGILGLVNVPIGTAIGVYTLFVLMQDAAAEYFAPQATT